MKNIVTILIGAFLLRIIISPFATFTIDQNTFIAWSGNLAQHGPSQFYEGWSDYLPGYLYVLWGLGKLNALHILPPVILYKLPAIVADIAAGVLLYLVVKRKKGERWGLIASGAYLLNPAVFANSAMWGQVDGISVLLLLLSVWFFETRWALSALALAAGVLVKPQIGLVAAILFLFMLVRKWHITKIISYISISVGVFVLGFVPFAPGANVVDFIIDRLTKSAAQYQYGSVNAFNMWALGGFWKSDITSTPPQYAIGLILCILVSVFVWLKVRGQKNGLWISVFAVTLASFVFLTRIHERHLLPAIGMLAPLIVNSWVFMLAFVALSLTYCANLFYSYYWIGNSFTSPYPDVLVWLFIVINLAVVGILLVRSHVGIEFEKKIMVLVKIAINNRFTRGKKPKEGKLPEIEPHLAKRVLLLIIVFAFASRTLFLSFPSNEYFDEVYHAFTARQMLKGNPMAWEWWNTPPDGFAYEWTHPPIAKLAMVVGMSVFGDNAFGWRIPGAILGTAVVVLIYLISMYLFNNRLVSLISAALFSLDGLALVSSRIGMNDTYFLFFVLLALYLSLKDKHLLSSFALGFAAASKWSTMWALPIFVVAHFALKKKISVSHIWYLVIPPLVYVGSYIPMFASGHDWETFIGVQKQMWWYHTNLRATHPYTSQWWTWPFLARPIWLYTNTVDGLKSNIYAMGNPFIFWFGVVGVLLSWLFAFLQRNRKIALIVFSYLIFFVPWAASPRIMFLYHYLPSIPFLSIALGYATVRLFKRPWIIVAIALVVFVYFFPHWTGIYVSQSLDNSYYWLSGWR